MSGLLRTDADNPYLDARKNAKLFPRRSCAATWACRGWTSPTDDQ